LFLSHAALRATGLLQPGSLVRWHYRLRLPDNNASDSAAAAALTAAAEKQLPDAGWEVRTRSNASPQLERNVERFTQYLTLGRLDRVAGGRGRRRQCGEEPSRPQAHTIAAMKALGATGARVFVIYLTQVLLLAGIGSVIGLAIGAALPFVILAMRSAVAGERDIDSAACSTACSLAARR